MTDFLANKNVRYAVLSVLILLSVFLAAATWNALFGRDQFEPVNVVTVEGTGEVSLVPDVAQITFSVTESAPSVKAAQDASTKKVDAAIEALKGLGVNDKDVKTLSYNVSPKYEYNQPCGPGMACPAMVSGSPRIVGYDVSQTIEVRVKDTAKASDVLAALGKIGVQNIYGPNFMVDDEDAARAEARGKAIEEARAKAKVLAKQLGVSLGEVVSYSEGGMYPEPMMYNAVGKGGMMDARVESAPSLPMGENETSVTVTITYKIH